MFALHGFDAYGLDVSETGIAEAKKFAALELKEPQSFNFGSFRGSDKNDVGTVSWFTDDFFSDWNKGTQFDIIYDYTVSTSNPSYTTLFPPERRRLNVLRSQLTRIVSVRPTPNHAQALG